MPSLWFCVPVHGRAALTRICLRQLRRTCDALAEYNIEASAVIVGDDENLETAAELGFATVVRGNEFLSAKFNDGIQAALDPAWNPRPADYVIPCGSDDWVDHRILRNLPGPDRVLAFRRAAFVSENGTRIASRDLDYRGGVGIRVYPRKLMAAVDYRPADEDRKRACDTSILVNLTQEFRGLGRGELRIVYGDQHEWQIVDWKSPGEQLNSWEAITFRHRRGTTERDPFQVLTGTYPAEALDEMRSHYDRLLVAA